MHASLLAETPTAILGDFQGSPDRAKAGCPRDAATGLWIHSTEVSETSHADCVPHAASLALWRCTFAAHRYRRGRPLRAVVASTIAAPIQWGVDLRWVAPVTRVSTAWPWGLWMRLSREKAKNTLMFISWGNIQLFMETLLMSVDTLLSQSLSLEHTCSSAGGTSGKRNRNGKAIDSSFLQRGFPPHVHHFGETAATRIGRSADHCHSQWSLLPDRAAHASAWQPHACVAPWASPRRLPPPSHPTPLHHRFARSPLSMPFPPPPQKSDHPPACPGNLCEGVHTVHVLYTYSTYAGRERGGGGQWQPQPFHSPFPSPALLLLPTPSRLATVRERSAGQRRLDRPRWSPQQQRPADKYPPDPRRVTAAARG